MIIPNARCVTLVPERIALRQHARRGGRRPGRLRRLLEMAWVSCTSSAKRSRPLRTSVGAGRQPNPRPARDRIVTSARPTRADRPPTPSQARPHPIRSRAPEASSILNHAGRLYRRRNSRLYRRRNSRQFRHQVTEANWASPPNAQPRRTEPQNGPGLTSRPACWGEHQIGEQFRRARHGRKAHVRIASLRRMRRERTGALRHFGQVTSPFVLIGEGH